MAVDHATTTARAAPGPVPSPDADLIELCARFDALQAAYVRAADIEPDDAPGREAAIDAIVVAQRACAERISGLPTMTRAGFRARAATLVTASGGEVPGHDAYGETEEMMVSALFRDLRGDDAPASVAASVDATQQRADEPAPEIDRDARLLALIEQYRAYRAEAGEASRSGDVASATEIAVDLLDLEGTIGETRAHSFAGLLEKAGLAAEVFRDQLGDASPRPGDRLALGMLSEIAAYYVAPLSPTREPPPIRGNAGQGGA